MTIVAAIQMCSTHVVDENLESAEYWIKKAVDQGAKLIVLPENFAIMGLYEFDKCKVKEDFGQGKIQHFLSDQAKQNHVWIVAGTIPIAVDDKNKVSAASLVFNDKGDCIARYNKIHLFDVVISDTEKYRESESIQSGKDIVMVDAPFGKLGLSVCYDIRFPELFRCLFKAGAEIITVPSAFTVKTGTAHWEVLLRARAIENFSYVIGAAQGGSHTNQRKTYGHSMIVDPWGDVIAKLDGVESGVICARIDLDKLHELRKAIPIGEHQKIFFESNIK